MEKKLSIPIIETIKKRQSIRTYEPIPLSDSDRQKILDDIQTLGNPFDIPVHIHMIDKNLCKDGEKLGTYGVIKGASTFLGVSIPNIEHAPLAAGYEFENLILCATHMGLGTVWLAATFNRNGFASAMDIKSNELFLAVSPIGYPASKSSLKESLMRSTMKSSTRKSWDALFYQADFVTPLTEDMAGHYAIPLEMLRLAPSAKNIQPWRVRQDQDMYHFYITYKPNLAKEEVIIKQVDMGIALSHFHQTAMELGCKGTFEILPQENGNLPENMHYIISWHASMES